MHSQIGQTKCVVWDCDDTLWVGSLIEGGGKALKPGIEDTIRKLDERGILQSIASKNDFDLVEKRLQDLNIFDFFVAPQVGWYPKSQMIKKICATLNIRDDSLLFIDDLTFERDEVRSECPEVLCFDADDYLTLLDMPCVNPLVISHDAVERRLRYQEEARRHRDQERFEGPSDAFLASLDMQMRIDHATDEDLVRAEELTRRTNQMNTTGVAYDADMLRALRQDGKHAILTCEVKDKYGPYGTVGLALLEFRPTSCHLRLFLTSCRVVNRGIGTTFLYSIINAALLAGHRVTADWRDTGRNRQMQMTYRLAGFRSSPNASQGSDIEELLLEDAPLRPMPAYVSVIETSIRDAKQPTVAAS